MQLSQKFSQFYAGARSVPILSKKSAPGLVLGTGCRGRTLGASDGLDVFRSSSAGASWEKVSAPHLIQLSLLCASVPFCLSGTTQKTALS